MSDWLLYLLALIGVIAVAVASAFLGRYIYFRQVRRSLVRLLGRREAIVAAAKGLELVIEHLLKDDGEALEEFASDPDDEDRRALEDIASRMRILADDLSLLPLPKRLWPIAEELEGVGRVLADEAGRVGESDSPASALDALGSIDVLQVRERLREIDVQLQPALDAFGVHDPAVYGGGLYI